MAATTCDDWPGAGKFFARAAAVTTGPDDTDRVALGVVEEAPSHRIAGATSRPRWAGSKLLRPLDLPIGDRRHRARIARYGTAWQNRGRRRVSRAAVGLVKANPADRPARSSGASSGGTTVAEAAGQGDARAVTQSAQTARCASSSPSSVVAGTASRSSRSPEPPRPRVTRLRSPAGRRWSRSSRPSGSRPTPRGRTSRAPARWRHFWRSIPSVRIASGARVSPGGWRVDARGTSWSCASIGGPMSSCATRWTSGPSSPPSGSDRGRAARATAVREATAPVDWPQPRKL